MVEIMRSLIVFLIIMAHFFANAQTITLDELKAFPSAVGFGQNTTGGANGNIVLVTNLNNSGAGSLRDAVEVQTGPRIVIFRVSGYIELTSYITVNSGNGNITIAGESAPGDGITLKGYGIEIRESNVIIRHIRARTGKQYTNTKGFRIVNWSNNKTIENIIIDHCSTSWGTDENLAFTNFGTNSKIEKATVQNCIISENMGSGAVLLMYETYDITFYSNYLANNTARMLRPSTSGPRFEGINNIFYNYRNGTEVSYDCDVDMIGNIYKNGSGVTAMGSPMRYISSSNTPTARPEDGNLFQTDNIKINNSNPMTNSAWDTYSKGSRVITNSPLTPYPSAQVIDKVLNDVGKYPHDAVDVRTIAYFANNGGALITDEDQVGGYPVLSTGTPYPMTIIEGMDDNWVALHGITSRSQVKPTYTIRGKTIINNAGYPAIEMFLSDLAGDPERLPLDSPSGVPVITLLGSNPMHLQVGQSYNEPGATATNTSNSVNITGTVNTSESGTYYRYYNVSNETGAAEQKVRTVIVSDSPQPGTSKGFNRNILLTLD